MRRKSVTAGREESRIAWERLDQWLAEPRSVRSGADPRRDSPPADGEAITKGRGMVESNAQVVDQANERPGDGRAHRSSVTSSSSTTRSSRGADSIASRWRRASSSRCARACSSAARRAATASISAAQRRRVLAQGSRDRVVEPRLKQANAPDGVAMIRAPASGQRRGARACSTSRLSVPMTRMILMTCVGCGGGDSAGWT